MTTNDDSFSSRLIQARSAKGWSQQDLSKSSGVAAAQISRYEQGSNSPRPPVVAKLANALGISFPWLLTGLGKPVESNRIGWTTIKVQLPVGLISRLEKAATENGHTVDEEVKSRLQATFDETVVTTVEAKVRPGAEEKRFEFNADEIADRVIERLEGRSKRREPSRVILVGDIGRPPDMRSLQYATYADVIMRGPMTPANQRGSEPYGPKKSSKK